MSYIHWLLHKLSQEVNYGSDDADEIFDILQECSNTPRRFHYVKNIRKLWAEQKRTQNLKNFVITYIANEFNVTSLVSQADLCLIEFRLLAELFVDFVDKSGKAQKS